MLLWPSLVCDVNVEKAKIIEKKLNELFVLNVENFEYLINVGNWSKL